MPPEPTPASSQASASIAAGLFKLALVLRHQSWKAAGEQGLTPTQSQILALLASRPAEIGVKVVAEQLAVTMGTASEAITALERKALLTKVASPSDGRALLLRLTRLGRKEARRCSEWPEVLLQAAGALPPSEQAGFVRGLIAMLRELQERGAVPMARMCVGCRFFRPNTAPGQPKAHYCNYIQAPIGDVELRVDCPEMEPVPAEMGPRLWNTFVAGTSLDDDSNPVAP